MQAPRERARGLGHQLCSVAAVALLYVLGACAAAPASAPAPVRTAESVDLLEPGLSFDRHFVAGTPEAVGLSRAALERLVADARAADTDALLVVKNGKIVVERYFGRPQAPIEIMSVNKSISCLAILRLLTDGKIDSLDAPLSTWYPEWGTGAKAAVTVRHVLTHTSGLEHDKMADELAKQDDRLEYVRGKPITVAPGHVFSYNNEAVQLLSGIVRAAAGKPIDAYLGEVLFKPLGIDTWTWEHDKAGNAMTYYGLALTARDLAKIGVMLLQRGAYDGKTILSAEWVARATSAQSEAVPYHGLLFWIRNRGPHFIQTVERVAALERRGFGAASKLAPLTGQRFGNQVSYWLAAGSILGDDERAALVSALGDDNMPFVVQPRRQIGFYANGWLGQYLLVYPELGIVVVRQHRAPPGRNTEEENTAHGFKQLPDLIEASW